jgi:hypothetical protein
MNLLPPHVRSRFPSGISQMTSIYQALDRRRRLKRPLTAPATKRKLFIKRHRARIAPHLRNLCEQGGGIDCN